MKTWIVLLAVIFQGLCLAGNGWAQQPYTRIVEPVQGQCVPGPDVVVKFEAGGMTLGASAWNLHFMLDDEPFQVQYDGNHAHVFKNVMPGTHTVRMWAANAMQESVPGTLSVVTFSVAYWDGANAPEAGAPLLTYNLPQGEYLGVDAADITVDFIVSNVTLSPSGYQVAYYVDGRRFLVQDHCGPRHIKGLEPGLHRVRVELQNQFGDLVPGEFNSTERTILVSPDRIAKSASPVDDGYRGLPRIDSIKGSMTMGQDWVATQQVRPVTKEDLEKQRSLTVRTGEGQTIGLSEPTEGELVTIRGESGEYSVRQGGEPELDSAAPEPSVQVRTGSILVEPKEAEEVEVLDEDGAPVTSAAGVTTVETDVVESPVRRTPAAATLSTEGVRSGSIDVTPDEAKATTASATRVRRRADGTTSTVRMTTETLRLSEAKDREKAEAKTTSTVRVEDAGSTRPRARVERGDRRTTEGRRSDRNTTAPPAARLD